MSIRRILKPKTRSQMIDDFMTTHRLKEHDGNHQYKRDLKRFAKGYTRPHKTRIWAFAIFIWVFCLSWMIQAGVALNEKFFWFPIEPGTPSMLSFINIFWVILWFAVPTAAIVWSIVKVAQSYTNGDD